jgi:hypothetical protein
LPLNLYSTLPTELRPIWMSVNATHLMVTVWEDGNLILRRWTLDPNIIPADEYSMGAATMTQLEARERVAYPLRVIDSGSGGFPFYVHGRMIDPANLTGTYQAVRADAAATWVSLHSDATSTEYIVSMKASRDRGGATGRQILWYKQPYG